MATTNPKPYGAAGPGLPDIRSSFVGPDLGMLELRISSLEKSVATLKHRIARQRPEEVDNVVVHMTKTITFHLHFTVGELAEFFEVDPESIRADPQLYGHEMASKEVIAYLYNQNQAWPEGITKVEVMSTDAVKVVLQQ